jgi:transposase
MAAKAKLSPEQWNEVRARWEGDERKGFPWLVADMALPVSDEAVRQRAKAEGWSKLAAKVGKQPESKLVKATKSKLADDAEADQDARTPGRPTLYRVEYIEQARRLALLGLTNDEMADFFGVGPATFDRWMAAHDEFRCAISDSKLIADGEIALSLYKRAKGYSHPDVHISNFQGEITVTELTKHYPPDTGAARLWLFNRQPELWRDKVEVKSDVNLNVFPPKEVLDAIYEKALAEAAEREAFLIGRRERLLGSSTEQEEVD